jgi:hypothetical protein
MMVSIKVKNLELGSTSAPDPPALGGRLARARLTRTLSSLALPSLAATTGRAAAPSCLRPALCRRRAHPPGMPAPSLSFCCARRSTPNPNKTICIGSESSYNILPTNFDFVCKNYRVYMCTPMSYAGSAPGVDNWEFI